MYVYVNEHITQVQALYMRYTNHTNVKLRLSRDMEVISGIHILLDV